MSIIKRTPKADNAQAANAQAPAFEDMSKAESEQLDAQAAGQTSGAAEVVQAEVVEDPRKSPKPADTTSKTIEGDVKEVGEDGQPVAAAAAEPEAKPQRAVVAVGKTLPTLLSSGAAVNVLAALENALQKSGIEVEYGMFPRLRLDSGVIATAEGAEAGEWIEIQVISYGKSWAVAIGEDTKESKEMVRYSSDGVVIDKPLGDKEDEWAGKTCVEYRDHLVSQGYEKAKISEYTMVYGIAVSQEKMDFKHANDLVVLQMPPSSARDWKSYVLNRAIHARIGKIKEKSGNPVVRFSSERVKSDAKTFFKITPTHGVADPIDFGAAAE